MNINIKNLSIFLLLSFLSTEIIFSQTRFDICPLKVGSELPDSLKLTSLDGQTVDFLQTVTEKPTVLIFYRGGWCGYCTKQLSGLRNIKSALDNLGWNLVAISPDKFTEMEKTAASEELDYDLYSDASANVISAFGLQWKVDDETFVKYKTDYKLDLEAWSGEDHHLLPVPAVYVIKDSLVQFQYVNPNHSTRLNENTLLAVLKTL